MDIDNVNHVGMAVRDLAATAARFEAMGFRLTPYSPHSGAWKPGEPVRPLGSGNRCVMFADDYLEILGSEDPERPAERIANFLARHEGGHIICFNAPEVDAVDTRLRAAGIATSGVIPLQREIETPDGVRTAKFERVQFSPGGTPEGYVQAARHLTPDYIYQPRYIAHPNGCTQLSDTIVVTDDLDGTARRYAGYLGRDPVPEVGTLRFRFPAGSRLTLVSARDASATLSGTLLPPIPGIAGAAFKTPDLDAIRARLRSGRIVFAERDGRVIVPAEHCSGLAILFET